ncbi:glycosyltransferase family 4 protein [Aliidiomarina indica]|uniref:glycosyltransferase family 4 protein n=1 Tax=Aliidiomarina indica TaxID=2749147 RepID=UPI00188DFFD9|nr:glycosyltransferase family 4 protein [Aliidiomarina indica]
MTILLIGPRLTPSKQPGGIVVSFELLVNKLREFGYDVNVIDNAPESGVKKMLFPFRFVFELLFKLKSCSHVSFHGTARQFVFLSPLVVFFSKLFNKTVSLRKFAGSFDAYYFRSNWLCRTLIRYSLTNANANFFQTLYLVKFFKRFNKNTFWLPTSRQRYLGAKRCFAFKKRFIYIGHVARMKGILELVEVMKRLPEDYNLDVYGPLVEKDILQFLETSRIMYRGVLRPELVTAKLCEYDVLVLPTKWKTEGYPGVIIESFSVGLPVIATNLRGISEIVEHASNGFLTPIGDVDKLTECFLSFNEDNYRDFSIRAHDSFEVYDIDTTTKFFISKVV